MGVSTSLVTESKTIADAVLEQDFMSNHTDETVEAAEAVIETVSQMSDISDKIAVAGIANAVMSMILESGISAEVILSEINHQGSDIFGVTLMTHQNDTSETVSETVTPTSFKGMTAPRKLTQEEIDASVTDDAIVSFENGKAYKTIMRHLNHESVGLTPDEYKQKWGLPDDYPMVSASYSRKRSGLAKELGLGRKKGNGPTQAELKAEADNKLAEKTDYTLNGQALPQGVVDVLSSTAKRKKEITEGQVITATVTDEHIISLIDGKPYRTLPRHLSSNGMSQEQYRETYGLSDKYPMSSSSFKPGIKADKS